MPTFLSGTNRGWVRKLAPLPGAAGAIVSGINLLGCMIHRIHTTEQVNVQFMHTLGKSIYVYVFGDRIGEMGVGGLAYWDCDAYSHGIDNAILYYRSQRLAQTGSIINVTVDRYNLEGFLTGFRVDTARVDDGLLEFYLQFALIPQELAQ